MTKALILTLGITLASATFGQDLFSSSCSRNAELREYANGAKQTLDRLQADERTKIRGLLSIEVADVDDSWRSTALYGGAVSIGTPPRCGVVLTFDSDETLNAFARFSQLVNPVYFSSDITYFWYAKPGAQGKLVRVPYSGKPVK